MRRGKGQWITVYTNPGHAYVVIAGLRLDTEGDRATYDERSSGDGPRWRKYNRSPRGFTARHPSASRFASAGCASPPELHRAGILPGRN